MPLRPLSLLTGLPARRALQRMAAAWRRIGPKLLLAATLLFPPLLEAWDPERTMHSAERMGPRAQSEARALLSLINEAARVDEEAKLRNINQFFNQHILFREDVDNWGQVDYWASPLESLNRGYGDCEDYAIAKYFSLIAAGVAPQKLRMVYVRAQVGGQVLAHMVLAYYPDPSALPLILDNLVGEIRPASRRPDLAPVFSFNAEGLWQGVGGTSAGDPLARLSRWRDVLNKVKQEGLW